MSAWPRMRAHVSACTHRPSTFLQAPAHQPPQAGVCGLSNRIRWHSLTCSCCPRPLWPCVEAPGRHPAPAHAWRRAPCVLPCWAPPAPRRTLLHRLHSTRVFSACLHGCKPQRTSAVAIASITQDAGTRGTWMKAGWSTQARVPAAASAASASAAVRERKRAHSHARLCVHVCACKCAPVCVYMCACVTAGPTQRSANLCRSRGWSGCVTPQLAAVAQGSCPYNSDASRESVRARSS